MMMIDKSRKSIILLALSLGLMFLHAPFADMADKVDVFLFREIEDLPKWIAHDTSFYLNNILLVWAVYLLTPLKHKQVVGILLVFAIFRLVEYFTFRGLLPMLPTVGGLLIYVIGTIFYKK